MKNLFLLLMSYFLLGTHDTWAQTDDTEKIVPSIKTMEHSIYRPSSPEEAKNLFIKIKKDNKNTPSINTLSTDDPKLLESLEPNISKGQKLLNLSEEKIGDFLYHVRNDPWRYFIITFRTVSITGFALHSTYISAGEPLHAAAIYAASIAILQVALATYNKLELRYLAKQVKFDRDKFKNKQWPLYIDDKKGSSRVAHAGKWFTLDVPFYAITQGVLAAVSPNIAFSVVHIMAEVLTSNILSVYLQEPMDSHNSSYSTNKYNNFIKNAVNMSVKEIKEKTKAIDNWGNARTAAISIFSTVSTFIFLNPHWFTDSPDVELAIKVGTGTVMVAVGSYAHRNLLRYLKQAKKQTQSSEQVSPLVCSAIFAM